MERFHELTEETKDYIDWRFSVYLFYTTMEDGDRYYECSSCRQSGVISRYRKMEREQDYVLDHAKHNDTVRCPFCGRVCTLKNNGKAKKRKNLWEERRYVLCEIGEHGEVLLRALDTWRGYGNTFAVPTIVEKRRYILTPGKVEVWDYNYYYKKWTETKRTQADAFPDKCAWGHTGKVPDTSYEFIDIEKIYTVDFMKYCSLDLYLEMFSSHDYVGTEIGAVKWLCEYAKNPRMEMFLKCGMKQLLRSNIIWNRKLRGLVNWKAKSPWDALKMTKNEYKIFMTAENSMHIEILDIWKEIRDLEPKFKIESAIAFAKKRIWYDNKEQIKKYVIGAGFSIERMTKYVEKGLYYGQFYWRDYIKAAENLGYDLKNEVVLFPKNLKEEHDKATAAVRYQANREMEEAAKKSLAKRRKRLNLEGEIYFIRIAENMSEIIEEGKTLKHCVGGYAERHMKDQTTILFLRKLDAPDEPLYTVEYRDGRVVQAHGFKNADLPEDAEAFLDDWKKKIKTKQKKEEAGAKVTAPAA